MTFYSQWKCSRTQGHEKGPNESQSHRSRINLTLPWVLTPNRTRSTRCGKMKEQVWWAVEPRHFHYFQVLKAPLESNTPLSSKDPTILIELRNLFWTLPPRLLLDHHRHRSSNNPAFIELRNLFLTLPPWLLLNHHRHRSSTNSVLIELRNLSRALPPRLLLE